MKIDNIKEIVRNDLMQLNKFIKKNLYSNINLIIIVCNYLIKNSGKKVRPLLLLLIIHAFGNKMNKKHLKLACAIEYIHTATLLHDDVVDKSIRRRGRITVNKKWNNKIAILVGDFLYSRAFQLIAEIKNLNILNILTNTTNYIAEGEILQLTLQKKVNVTEQEYFTIIQNKTAKLFEAITIIGTIISHVNNKADIENIRKYGYHFGIAYQLLNDIIDCYVPMKKNDKKYNDLQDGKLTLPFLHCLHVGTDTEKEYIKTRLGKKLTKMEQIIIHNILKKTNSFTYTEKLIKIQVSLALGTLQKIAIKNIYIHSLRSIVKNILKIK